MEIIKSNWENPTAAKENIEAIATAVTEMANEVKVLTQKITELLATKAEFAGVVKMDSLPTSDPSNPGQLYNDSGTVKISQ